MKAAFAITGLLLPVAMIGQPVSQLPEVTVYSDRVANQAPAATFAMPVSGMRFEPRVDIHARNLTEGQADITIRGGIFENTAFELGAVTILDPQTGHYFAELPVAPALLTAATVRTGPDLAISASNASVGSIHYGWRPIRTAGAASIGMGDFNLRRAELYQGFATSARPGGTRLGVDIALAHSESDGSIPFGEHAFDRGNVRLQRADDDSQTDLFAGYQGKRFGWPNLYTPFNSHETENLQTTLFLLNHRTDFGGDEFLELGAFHRRNKDDYAFDRHAPLGPVHPFQHTTWISGVAGTARQDLGWMAINLRGEILADEITSSSLTFGRYRSRTLTKFAAVPQKEWHAADGTTTRVLAGLSYEDSNREGGSLSPVFTVVRDFPSAALRRISFSYVKTSQVPTYTALNSSATAGLFRGNPDLGRERAHNLEIGVTGSLGGWSTEAAVFWRRHDSLVDWTFQEGVTARTADAVDVDVSGFELLARRSWRGADVVIGYTGLSKDADYRGQPVDASFYALNYARHRLTAAATLRLGHGFELRLDNVVRIQAANMLRVIGGDEAVLTAAGLSYQPAQWHGVELMVQVDNLWDSDFQDVPAVPAARRQCSAMVNYVW